ncbi:hypothetical protein BD414DRAFT_482144 [Trametes punicea]|nr:hypothetical protein BD414DRAFT_482144 [Trametes punicea]
MGPSPLSYDVLILVFVWLRDDYKSLFSCSLVNRTFRDAAATYLYWEVTYSPPFSPVLDLRKRDDFQEGFFVSARLPHYAPLVRRLEISGYLSSRPPPMNKFPAQLKSAVECWPVLNVVTLSPKTYHESVFTDVLPLLGRLSFLRSLTVNAACTDEQHTPTLVQIRQLESLTIESPTRAILQRLPDWLAELQKTLRTFRLTHSCGSVTPGVLRSFIPHLQHITSFGLGLSYSLTDNDVFAFWQELPSLHTLEFRYYLQLRPSIPPRLPLLRHLTVRYSNITARDHANRLCRWVRRVVAKSPLESLRLVCENEVHGPAVSFDPLVEHLSLKHAAELRLLHMRDCFVGRRMFMNLCRTCTHLEELDLSISRETLDEVTSIVSTCPMLHTVKFHIRNCRRRVEISQEFAEQVVKSAPKLRRLAIDGKCFEGTWTSTPYTEVQFVVKQVWTERARFPWERGAVEEKERTHHH